MPERGPTGHTRRHLRSGALRHLRLAQEALRRTVPEPAWSGFRPGSRRTVRSRGPPLRTAWKWCGWRSPTIPPSSSTMPRCVRIGRATRSPTLERLRAAPAGTPCLVAAAGRGCLPRTRPPGIAGASCSSWPTSPSRTVRATRCGRRTWPAPGTRVRGAAPPGPRRRCRETTAGSIVQFEHDAARRIRHGNPRAPQCRTQRPLFAPRSDSRLY